MGAYLNALREEATKEDLLIQIERLLDERDAYKARLAEAVEVGDALRAAIAYAQNSDDGLIFLSEWSEGNPDAMAELDKWRLAKLEGRA